MFFVQKICYFGQKISDKKDSNNFRTANSWKGENRENNCQAMSDSTEWVH